MGASLEMCSCGTFAIGRCSGCGIPVCGIHSALHADRRLCLEHMAAEDTVAKDAAAESKRVAVWKAWSHRLDRLCEGLATISDPAERALGAIVSRPRLFADPPGLPGRPTGELDALPHEMRHTIVADYRTAIEDSFGRVFPAGQPMGPFERRGPDPVTWRWDPAQLMAWVARRARPGTRLTLYDHKPGWRGADREKKVGTFAAWKVGERFVPGEGRYPGIALFAYLLANGEAVEAPRGKSKAHRYNERRPIDRLEDLEAIAELLRIRVPGAPA